MRIASVAGIVASFTAIGVFVRKGDSNVAGLLVFAAVGCAILFAWSWKQSFLAPLEWAKRYVEGVEGDERHEWYAFKGQRVRVFLDEKQQPWFAVNEIAFILALEVDEKPSGITARTRWEPPKGSPRNACRKADCGA